ALAPKPGSRAQPPVRPGRAVEQEPRVASRAPRTRRTALPAEPGLRLVSRVRPLQARRQVLRAARAPRRVSLGPLERVRKPALERPGLRLVSRVPPPQAKKLVLRVGPAPRQVSLGPLERVRKPVLERLVPRLVSGARPLQARRLVRPAAREPKRVRVVPPVPRRRP